MLSANKSLKLTSKLYNRVYRYRQRTRLVLLGLERLRLVLLKLERLKLVLLKLERLRLVLLKLERLELILLKLKRLSVSSLVTCSTVCNIMIC